MADYDNNDVHNEPVAREDEGRGRCVFREGG
jgi:hypothetical protein